MKELTFWEIFRNPVFVPGITAWFLAQIIKVILTWITQRRMDMSRFVGSGGMPSSHSSLVTSVAVSVGLLEGFGSPIFGLSLVLALVVMYDAANVRRAAGDQARILNRVVGFLFREEEFDDKQLKELLGHKPIEVLAGALLGTLTALVFYWLA